MAHQIENLKKNLRRAAAKTLILFARKPRHPKPSSIQKRFHITLLKSYLGLEPHLVLKESFQLKEEKKKKMDVLMFN